MGSLLIRSGKCAHARMAGVSKLETGWMIVQMGKLMSVLTDEQGGAHVEERVRALHDGPQGKLSTI